MDVFTYHQVQVGTDFNLSLRWVRWEMLSRAVDR